MSRPTGKSWGNIPRWWVVIVVVILVAAAITIGVTLAGDNEADTTVGEGSLTTTSSLAGLTTSQSSPLESTSTTSGTPASTSTTLPPAATTSSSSTTTSLWMINPTVSIDPGVILQLATRYEDTHPNLQWVGTWVTATSSAHSGGSAKYTNTQNSRVGIEFEGTGVQLIANTPVEAGRLTVHLYGSNGVDILETIDLAGAGASNVEVWYSGSLPNGQYQCWFGYDATHIPAGRLAWVDAIDVWGTVSPP